MSDDDNNMYDAALRRPDCCVAAVALYTDGACVSFLRLQQLPAVRVSLVPNRTHGYDLYVIPPVP